MKARTNAATIMAWLKESRQGQAATARQVAASGLMDYRAASEALKFGAEHGVFARVKRDGAAAHERVAFELTGKPLSALKVRKSLPVSSFDALLGAWGIPTVPPRVTQCVARIHELACDNEE